MRAEIASAASVRTQLGERQARDACSARQVGEYRREEIFGPEAALYPVDDLDEAIHAINDSDYGLAASVFTRDRAQYDHCVGRVRTGILNWNKGTTGASGKSALRSA